MRLPIVLNVVLLSLPLFVLVTHFDVRIMKMVSYKRLNPENVQFSSASEPSAILEEVPVSFFVYIYCLPCNKISDYLNLCQISV